jgi:hypothetical protein
MINPVHRHSFLERCNPYPHVTFAKRRRREKRKRMSLYVGLSTKEKREKRKRMTLYVGLTT